MTENLIINSFNVDQNILAISIADRFFSENNKLKVALIDRETENKTEYEVMVNRDTDTSIINLNLDEVDFSSELKSIVDVLLIIDDVHTYKLLQPVPKNKDRSIMYHKNSYHINTKAVAVPYLSLQNSLSILYGNKEEIYGCYCAYINDLVTVSEVLVSNNMLGFSIYKHEFDQADDIYFIAKKRDFETSIEIINHHFIGSNHFVLDLENVNWDAYSRYDLYLYVKIDRVVYTYRVGTNEKN